MIATKRGAKRLAFVVGKPPRALGSIGQKDKRGDAEQDGRHALDQEEPLPSVEPGHAAEREEHAR